MGCGDQPMIGNMNTDDVLEMLAEHGNPRVGRTRNIDAASPHIRERDPDGVNWTVEVSLIGFHNDSGSRVNIIGSSSTSAKEAAMMASALIDDFFENGKAKPARERYLQHFAQNAEMWIKKPGGYYHGDYGPKQKPRFETVKNDPCEEPTELLERLAATPDR